MVLYLMAALYSQMTVSGGLRATDSVVEDLICKLNVTLMFAFVHSAMQLAM